MSFISEHQTINKNFDELQKDIDKLKEITVQKFKTLEETTEFKKIQEFKSLWLESINIRLIENSSWYNSYKRIRVSFNKECYKYIFENCTDQIKNILDYQMSKHPDYISRIIEFIVTEDSNDKLNTIKDIINNVYEQDLKTHEENIKILDDNKNLQNGIFNLLKQIGVTDKYYGFKSNRHKKQDWISYNWPHEISKQIPTNYSKNKCEELKNKKIKQLDELYKKEVKRIKDERLKKEKEQQEKLKNKQLALLLAKYDLELTDDWEELMHRIIKKNKYLWLGYYLEENRNDWSDGCDNAEFGLSYFKIESNLDKLIHSEIESLINDWQGDGRVFRDCQYNYSVLYRMVTEQDNELYNDFEVVRKYIND